MLPKIEQEFEMFQYHLESTEWQTSLPTFQLNTSKKSPTSPKVSVIIANFNNAPYLNKMMDSLMDQTIGLEHLQIMFIDDKSTDNSLEIIMPYLDKYQSVEIYALDENTGGAHGPRNIGILNARGEYLVFLDADDWYDLEALGYLSQLLDASGDDFAVSGLVQSKNGEISLKSKPYFYDGDFKNRSIQDLPSEFYGWLGPQAIMVRRSLVIDNNLHFVNQRVADDVTFFYEAMRFAKTITQGSLLTTYLNRDNDNVGLSKAINRNFMISWLRALSYINDTFPDDISKERFLARRLEWLIHDFCLKRNIGYKYSKARLKDFKEQLDNYLGSLFFNPSQYFRNDFRKSTWELLEKNDIPGLYRFVFLFSVRWVLNRKLKLKTRTDNTYYYPQLLKSLPSTRLDAYVDAVKNIKGKINVNVFSYKKTIGFEVRDISHPYYMRRELSYQKLSENTYQIILPEDYVSKKECLFVVFDDYSEIGIASLEQM